MNILHSSFFAADTVKIAPALLGKILVVNGCIARIVETEAYTDDPASHAYTKTARSALMFDTYGYVYVYMIYGMYYCLNFTTEKKKAGAVLIRATEPISGIEGMKKRRKTKDIYNLCSGPGKLCAALGIDKKHNGTKIGDLLKLHDDGYKVPSIGISSRIGITEGKELPWRFFVEGSKWVSR